MTRREPRCSAIIAVKYRGSYRCPMAGTWRFDHKWLCEPHFRAAVRVAAA